MPDRSRQESLSSPTGDRRLHLAFPTAEAFLEEYERNIQRGGAFVPTQETFELREIVTVSLDLAFHGEVISLRAEVVHAAPGGVAVEFLEPTPDLRERLEPLVSHAAERAERRDSPRDVARVLVRLQAPTGSEMEGRMRNVSRSGALITVEGSLLPVGRTVRLQVSDPESGAPVEVVGKVIRHLEGEGTIPAVAVRFEPPPDRRDEVGRVMDAIQRTDQRLRRDGIGGPIEEVGTASLIQMFAGFATRGTLILIHDVEEATIAFEEGQLLHASVGEVTGIKALKRVLTWHDGEFEFRANVDGVPEDHKPALLEGAILEAMRRLDEEKRLTLPSLAPKTRLEVARDRLDGTTDLTQTEEAVLDLATAGFTVRRMLDVIPEDDAEVHAAITSLFERGLVTPIPED